MPIGLFLWAFLSVVVYRRCQASGRRAWAWIPLTWLFAAALGIAAPTIVGYWLIFNYPDITERDAMPYLYAPSLIGLIVGASMAIWLAGRPLKISYEISN
jgi:hypothetical protein